MSSDPKRWIRDPQLRTLAPDAARLIEPQIANAARRTLEESEPDYYATPRQNDHIWWLQRTPVLNDKQSRRLLSVAPQVEVPDCVLEEILRVTTNINAHQPLVGSVIARTRFPRWWDDVKASLAKRDTTSTDPMDRVAALMLDGDFTRPDLPRGMEWTASDQLCLWVATAALMRAFPQADRVSPTDSRLCRVCGRSFRVGGLTIRHALYLRRDECCPICADDAYYGSRAPFNEDRSLAIPEVLRHLASEWGGPPPRKGLRLPIMAETVEEWTRSLVYRILLPNEFSSVAWTSLLASSGLLEDGLRLSRGVASVAADGHFCRSLLERHIDDFFTMRGIAHITEPYYPLDQELNTTGLRADWRLEDGTYVEAAGMMSEVEYEMKMKRKKTLAAKHGIRLIVITPDDLADLSTVFTAR